MRVRLGGVGWGWGGGVDRSKAIGLLLASVLDVEPLVCEHEGAAAHTGHVGTAREPVTQEGATWAALTPTAVCREGEALRQVRFTGGTSQRSRSLCPLPLQARHRRFVQRAPGDQLSQVIASDWVVPAQALDVQDSRRDLGTGVLPRTRRTEGGLGWGGAAGHQFWRESGAGPCKAHGAWWANGRVDGRGGGSGSSGRWSRLGGHPLGAASGHGTGSLGHRRGPP